MKNDSKKRNIRNILKYTNSILFFYDDLHNANIPTKSHFDFQKIIDEVGRLKKLNPEDTLEYLLNSGVLTYLPDNEFEVNLNDSIGSTYDDTIVILRSDDEQLVYHELAHLIQEKQALLSDGKIKDLYENVGMNIDKEPYEQKKDYKNYLQEMHAEVFSYTVLLMQAKSFYEFFRTASTALHRGAHKVIAGSFEKNSNYYNLNSRSKYYASFNVMLSMIHKVYKIRKAKQMHKYMKENGVINIKNVSHLAEKIVHESCYSPKEFDNFKRHRVNFSSTKRGLFPIDHSHLQDFYRSNLIYGVSWLFKYKTPIDTYTTSSHDKLCEEYLQENINIAVEDTPENLSDKEKAEHSIRRIKSLYVVLNKVNFKCLDVEELIRIVTYNRYKKRDFSPKSRKRDVALISKIIGVPNNDKAVSDIVEIIDEVLMENKMNPEFHQIMRLSKYSYYQQEKIKNKNLSQDEIENLEIRPILFDIDDVDEIEQWVQLGVNVNARDKKGNTALMLTENVDKIKVLLKHKADINACDIEGGTALMYAVNDDVIDVLLENGAGVNIKDKNGNTALVRYPTLSKMKKIIKNHADVNFKNNMGHSPLMIVATSNLNIDDKTNILKLLIEAGADIDYAVDNLPAKKSKLIRDIVQMKTDKKGNNLTIARTLSNSR